jgi:chloramphenicol 3-O phosphotransferase
MSRIIFLNGSSSAGKSTIAQSIQNLSADPWLAFGFDTFFKMAPNQQDTFDYSDKSGYLNFSSGKNSHGPTMRVEKGPKSDQLFGLMPEFAKLLASRGNDVIIDEVLFDNTILKSYLKELRQHTVYFIAVTCDLRTMQERELLRGDRAIGLSNDLMDRVHSGLREYDLTVDTTSSTAVDNAKKILNYVNNHSEPQGFSHMRQALLVKM